MRPAGPKEPVCFYKGRRVIKNITSSSGKKAERIWSFYGLLPTIVVGTEQTPGHVIVPVPLKLLDVLKVTTADSVRAQPVPQGSYLEPA